MIAAMVTDPRIGTRIARRRHVLGWTQQQLADALSVSKSTVAAWESGKHFPLRKLGAVEDVLGISLDAEPEISPALRGMIAKLTPDERAWVMAQLRKASGPPEGPREDRPGDQQEAG